jgi:hypothetical protein
MGAGSMAAGQRGLRPAGRPLSRRHFSGIMDDPTAFEEVQ